MVERARNVDGDVVVECTARVEREQLHPVADPQYGKARDVCGREQRAVEGDLGLLGEVEGDMFWICAIRREVVASGKEQGIDPCDQLGRTLWRLQRQQDGQPARALDRTCVRLIDVEVAAPGAPAPPSIHTQRNSDRGPHA